MHDLVIRDGTIIDGTGGPAHHGDVVDDQFTGELPGRVIRFR